LFVKFDVGRAAKTPALGVLVKNAAQKKRIITDVGAEQKRLRSRGAGQSDQHVGNILALSFLGHVRRTQPARARERFEERRDVIAQFPVRNPDIAQDMARQDIKIKVRGNLEMPGIRKDRVHQPRIIQNRIAGFGVAQKIDQRHVIGLGAGQNADDKIEIRRREARPTIRLDHRGRIMSISDAATQARRSRLFGIGYFL